MGGPGPPGALSVFWRGPPLLLYGMAGGTRISTNAGTTSCSTLARTTSTSSASCSKAQLGLYLFLSR